MKVYAGNVWARAEGTHAELSWLHNYLSVAIPSAIHTDAYQAGRWDGRRYFVNSKGVFPSGFVRLVYGHLRKDNKLIEVVDERVHPSAGSQVEAGVWLHPEQREAVEACIKYVRGVVVMPTGVGKTEVFIALAQAVRVNWVILVSTRDLLHQTAARYKERTGEECGVIGDGEWSEARVTVATWHTLSKRVDGAQGRNFFEKVRGLIVDEVHELSGASYEVSMALSNAYYRIGVSATMLMRSDEKDFVPIAALGPVFHTMEYKEAVESGRIARGEVLMVRYKQPQATGSPDAVYEACITLNDERNALLARIIADSKLCPRPCLVLVKAIEHGYRLQKLITSLGLHEVEYVHGAHNSDQRQAAISRLKNGNTSVLIASTIFKRGIDIPSVESGVNASAGRSLVDLVQKIGRLGRVTETKTTFRYWDIYDDGRAPMLRHHAVLRLEAYRQRLAVRIVTQEELSLIAGQ